MKRLLSWFEREKYTSNTGKIEVPSVLQSRFEPQNRLEQLLVDAAYDPAAQPSFEKCFLDHEVLVAIRDDGQAAGVQEDAGELGLYTLAAEDDMLYPTAFTARDRGYECFGPDTLLAMMAGRDLVAMVSGAGIWINPTSAFGVRWTPDDLARVAAR